MNIKRKLSENEFKEQSGKATVTVLLYRFTVNSSSTVLSIYFTRDDSCVHLKIKNQTRGDSKE